MISNRNPAEIVVTEILRNAEDLLKDRYFVGLLFGASSSGAFLRYVLPFATAFLLSGGLLWLARARLRRFESAIGRARCRSRPV